MNLGTLLGEQQLRIYQLEEQLEKKAAAMAAGADVRDPCPPECADPPAARVIKGKRSEPDSAEDDAPKASLWARIRRVLRIADQPLSIDEIASEMPGESRERIANNISARTVRGELVRHGRRLTARYTLAPK